MAGPVKHQLTGLALSARPLPMTAGRYLMAAHAPRALPVAHTPLLLRAWAQAAGPRAGVHTSALVSQYFGGMGAPRAAYGVSSEDMRRLEMLANAAPHDAASQTAYLRALLDYGMPQEVARRIESGKFATDGAVLDLYAFAIARVRNLPEAELSALRSRMRDAWRQGGDQRHAYISPAAVRSAAGSHGGVGVTAYDTASQTAFGGAGSAGSAWGSSSTPAPAYSSPPPASSHWLGGYNSFTQSPVGAGGSAFGGAGSGGGANAAVPHGPPGSRTNPLVVEAVPMRSSALVSVLRMAMWLAVGYFLYTSMNKAMTGGALAQLTGEGAEEVTDVPTTRFADVKGVDEAKQELEDVVSFLRDPEKYRRLGAKVPRGVLLTGPPGTGKTLLARAVAGEARCKFYSKSASEFEEMFVGLGARRVRDLFTAARKNAPAIIFIDEIDALGGKRRMSANSGSERQTLNQLLSSMDGFSKNENVIVIAATNTPDILDAALVRPGRFDTSVMVPLPDVKGRKEIIDLYLSRVVVSNEIDSELLARATPGFSGAQIEAMVNSAALMAANRGADEISMVDIEEARDKVIMGPAKKSRVQKPETMRMTAFHEGGHTLAALLTPGANPLHKVTILPRGMSGGATWSLPSDEDYKTKANVLAEIDVCMGGRAAEELLNGTDNVTTGAGSDMQKASELARSFIMRFSMSDLGLTSFVDSEPSPAQRAIIDVEVERILQSSYARVLKLLKDNRAGLDALAAALLEYETLTADECRDVINGRPLTPLRDKLRQGAAQQRRPTAGGATIPQAAAPVPARGGASANAGANGGSGGAVADKPTPRFGGVWNSVTGWMTGGDKTESQTPAATPAQPAPEPALFAPQRGAASTPPAPRSASSIAAAAAAVEEPQTAVPSTPPAAVLPPSFGVSDSAAPKRSRWT